MKKLFFIITLFLCISQLTAQSTKQSINVNPYGGQNAVLYAFDPATGFYYAIKSDSTGALKIYGDALSNVSNYITPFTRSSGTLTTVSTETDTTVFASTKWQTFGVFALNDTLQISLSGSFTDAKMVLPYTEYTFEKFSPITFPKGYIKRYGTVGTVDYIPTIIGY